MEGLHKKLLQSTFCGHITFAKTIWAQSKYSYFIRQIKILNFQKITSNKEKKQKTVHNEKNSISTYGVDISFYEDDSSTASTGKLIKIEGEN